MRRHLTFSNVTALVALFVALGGVSYAAIVLPKNSVGAKQLKKDSVSSAKVADGSLQASDFKAGALPAGAPGPVGPAGPAGQPGAGGSAASSSGPAGGDLSGSYPNPSIGAGKVTADKLGVVPAASVANSIGKPTTNNSIAAVSFDTEAFDTAGLHSATEPSKLTAPITGIYQVEAHLSFAPNANGVRSVYLGINGSTSNPIGQATVFSGTAAADISVSTSGLAVLNAGDYVMALEYQNSGGPLTVDGLGNGDASRFSMRWVGPAS
jgi:hypothetical protein